MPDFVQGKIFPHRLGHFALKGRIGRPGRAYAVQGGLNASVQCCSNEVAEHPWRQAQPGYAPFPADHQPVTHETACPRRIPGHPRFR